MLPIVKTIKQAQREIEETITATILIIIEDQNTPIVISLVMSTITAEQGKITK